MFRKAAACSAAQSAKVSAERPKIFFNGVRRRARLLGVVGQRAEHPVGDILGNTLRDQGLANLLRRNFLPREFFSDGLADEMDFVALSMRLRAGK